MQEKKKRFKAVIFDVGGVLQTGNPSFEHSKIHIFVAEKLGVSIDQYFDSIDTSYAKSIEGKISEEKALSTMANNLKTTPKKLKSVYSKAYRKYFGLNKKLLKFAIKIKKKGYKTAILSDQWWVSDEVLITKAFRKNFDVFLVSCEVGVRKPNPKIYRLALKRLKAKPKEVIFIDNQNWNIKPARKLGINSILFKNNQQLFHDLKRLNL